MQGLDRRLPSTALRHPALTMPVVAIAALPGHKGLQRTELHAHVSNTYAVPTKPDPWDALSPTCYTARPQVASCLQVSWPTAGHAPTRRLLLTTRSQSQKWTTATRAASPTRARPTSARRGVLAVCGEWAMRCHHPSTTSWTERAPTPGPLSIFRSAPAASMALARTTLVQLNAFGCPDEDLFAAFAAANHAAAAPPPFPTESSARSPPSFQSTASRRSRSRCRRSESSLRTWRQHWMVGRR